jgi:hypothetical protein
MEYENLASLRHILLDSPSIGFWIMRWRQRTTLLTCQSRERVLLCVTRCAGVNREQYLLGPSWNINWVRDGVQTLASQELCRSGILLERRIASNPITNYRVPRKGFKNSAARGPGRGSQTRR